MFVIAFLVSVEMNMITLAMVYSNVEYSAD